MLNEFSKMSKGDFCQFVTSVFYFPVALTLFQKSKAGF